MIYKIVANENGFEILTRTNEDGSISYIPLDPANSDYQAYLKSLEEN
jgi:hypothetical protein